MTPYPKPKPRSKARKSTGPSADVRAAVISRAGGRCEMCQSSQEMSWSVHHRRPRGMGGTSSTEAGSPGNLVLLCGSGTTGCHGSVESRREDSRARGWLLAIGERATEVPVVDNSGRAWLLDDDGGKRLVTPGLQSPPVHVPSEHEGTTND